ncbi:MAG: imidazoleglycerol-phosphate dehydratase [Candidatus Latescibacterota bacterium]|jgi:imidazoleglycerol-phosphate dehydratase
MATERTETISRQTSETDISLTLSLDGSGACKVDTGIGFFDHMLTALTKHGLFDLTVTCKGDLEVDAHHTVEDVGICIGQVLDKALGDKKGITRFGSAYVPMDEALARAVIDLSGRGHLIYDATFTEEVIGTFPTSLGMEFFTALAQNGRFNLHIDLIRSSNAHHGMEAIFKAVARALRQAVSQDPRITGVPSTKGSL